MGSTEEDTTTSKPTSLYDAASSTEPLLFKPTTGSAYPSPPIEEPPQSGPSESDPTQSLQISFNYGPRPFKDLPFLILFLLFVLCTFAFGIFSIFHRNDNYSNVSAFTYDSNSTSDAFPLVYRILVLIFILLIVGVIVWIIVANWHRIELTVRIIGVASDALSRNLGLFLVIPLLTVGLLAYYASIVVFLVFSRFNGKIVAKESNGEYTCVWKQDSWVPAYFTLAILTMLWSLTSMVEAQVYVTSGTIAQWYFSKDDTKPHRSIRRSLRYLVSLSVVIVLSRFFVVLFILLIVGVIVWIIVANWHRIELTVRIIGVASDALSRNLGLFLVIPLLTVGLLAYYASIVVFLVFSRFNGKIVAKESNGEYTCVWKQDSWVPAYFTLAILTMLWSLTSMVEAQVYVTSGTIAQWYFSKDDTKPHRSIRRSLRNAFGPSSGTICLSGLLVFVVRVVRAAVDSAREEDVPGIVNLVLRCCVNALLSAIDFLNKFTINFAAITGEAYCTSARMTYELLRRNLLSAVFVETVSTRLLAGVIFVLSSVYAIAVCAILKGVSDLGVNMYTVAALAWVLLILLPISRNSRSSYPSRTLDV
ncbi:hypothetical protein GOBAR_DD10351 [Gossypium barbadense]|nr:hypothetical protein GOBAR_DD10351 [Gossypium barbadense]